MTQNISHELIREISAKEYFIQGFHYAQQGFHRDATQSYSVALAHNPYAAHLCSEVFFYRGISYTALRNFDAAVKDFTNALNLHRDLKDEFRAKILVGRAGVYVTTRTFKNAEDDFTQALACEIHSDFAATILVNRGFNYQRQKEWPKAKKDYAQALLCNPTIPHLKARILYHQGQNELALSAPYEAFMRFSEALENNPSNHDDLQSHILLHRGSIFLSYGCLENALIDYNTALTLSPSNNLDLKIFLYFYRAFIYNNKAQYRKSFEDCQAALACGSTDQNLLNKILEQRLFAIIHLTLPSPPPGNTTFS